MFNIPYRLYQTPYSREVSMFSYIRVLHASPNAPAVDVYANDKIIARNLTYRNFTPYIAVAPETYTIKIYPAGQTTSPVLTTDLQIPAYSILTIAAINMLEDLNILSISDPPIQPVPNMVNLRFANLSPNAPKVDLRLPDGRSLFTNVGYKEFTNYVSVPPGTYTIYVYAAGTNFQILYVPNINLIPDRFYTIYAVGLVGANPPLQVLIPLDGNSYIKF